jgi:GntP family gluconate:H+ symporter
LPAWWKAWQPAVAAVGNSNVALTLAAVIALVMLAVYHPSRKKGRLAAAVQAALMSGGVIILITAAGGAFGHVLKLTNIAGEMKALTPATGLIVLPVAFLITALVRTAQGSATVAMITAVGIVGPIAATGELPFHPVYLALAIGCGSKPISWMNDSGFWIIGRMSGFTEGETLRTATVMMALMGVVGLGATMVGAVVWPMAG